MVVGDPNQLFSSPTQTQSVDGNGNILGLVPPSTGQTLVFPRVEIYNQTANTTETTEFYTVTTNKTFYIKGIYVLGYSQPNPATTKWSLSHRPSTGGADTHVFGVLGESGDVTDNGDDGDLMLDDSTASAGQTWRYFDMYNFAVASGKILTLRVRRPNGTTDARMLKLVIVGWEQNT